MYAKLLYCIIIYVISASIIIIKSRVFIPLYRVLKLKATETLNNFIFFFEIFAVVFFIKFYKFVIYKTTRYRFVYDFNN